MFEVTLAKPYDPKKVQFPAVVMPKLDGVRATFRKPLPGDDGPQDGQYHFYSRGGADKAPKCWNDNVIAHILDPLRKAVGSSNTILDGEFYRHGWPLQKINGAIAVKRLEPVTETREIQYTVFDAAGPVANLNFMDRMRHAISVTGGKVANVHFIQYSTARSIDDIATFHSHVLGQGYEGTMVRNFAAPYENKRTINLQKFKNFIDAEFKCVGVYEGKETDKGSRLVGTLGGLTLVAENGNEFGCGSGFDDALRAQIWADPKSVIGKMITIQYFDLSQDGTPRMGTFRAVRDYE